MPAKKPKTAAKRPARKTPAGAEARALSLVQAHALPQLTAAPVTRYRERRQAIEATATCWQPRKAQRPATHRCEPFSVWGPELATGLAATVARGSFPPGGVVGGNRRLRGFTRDHRAKCQTLVDTTG